jgi:hypothetical protein
MLFLGSRTSLASVVLPFEFFWQGDSDVFVRIDPKNPGHPPRRVVWGEKQFKVVQALHEGEGHNGGVNKTRAKVADC